MRDRTADLFAASEALSQLSYSPKSGANFKVYRVCCQEFQHLLIDRDLNHLCRSVNKVFYALYPISIFLKL